MSAENEPKRVYRTKTLSLYGDESVKEVVDVLNKILEKHPDASLEILWDERIISASFYVMETPEEVQARLDRPNKERERRRQEYLKLKKEFEPDV